MPERCDRCGEILSEISDYYYTIPIVIKNAPGGPCEDSVILCEECFEKWSKEHRGWTF